MSWGERTSALEDEVKGAGVVLERAFSEISTRIIGQRPVVERLLGALIAEGHVLLEGLPGLAKTTTVKAVAETTGLTFSRIQFTPDLLPADVIGTQIYDPRTGEFRVRKGPIFANIVLADEINRAPAKVQSALLEAMQERQVTIGDTSHVLARPFLVLATQNPIEQEGTYPLPEAQVDRFLFKLRVAYGTPAEEEAIITMATGGASSPLTSVLDVSTLLGLRELLGKIHVADKIRRYVVDLVFATREPKARGLKDLIGMIEVGASPRASIGLTQAARATALMRGRAFVTPQDVKDVALDVLRHRLLRTFEAEADGVETDELVRRVLQRVDVP